MQILVDELPKCCRKCVFCYDNRPYWKSTDCFLNHKELDEDEIETSRDKDCPLIDIKTHDRELVKKVCEKIKQDCWYCWCGGVMSPDQPFCIFCQPKNIQNIQVTNTGIMQPIQTENKSISKGE